MKIIKSTAQKLFLSIFFSLFMLMISQAQTTPGVGVGTDTPDDSALMDVSSINQGFLLPRVTSETMIANPIEGMVIYNLTENCIQVYTNTGWHCVFFVMNEYQKLFMIAKNGEGIIQPVRPVLAGI